MLNDDDEKYLYEEVVRALGVGNPITLLSTCLPPACMDRIPRDLQYVDAYAREAVRRCKADRWKNNPCWLVLLFDLFPATPRSMALKQRLANPPRYALPAESRVLANDTPFLSRDQLRLRTRTLAARRSPKPILLVKGTGKCGKSYSYDYIDHLFTLEELEFAPFRVRFEKDTGLLFGPEQLARDILSQMGVEVPESFFSKDTNNVRWIYDLAGKVLAAAPKGRKFWIVLDNFDGPNLLANTVKFIDALARRIVDSTVHSENFRLVLLQFDPSHLTIERYKIDEEQIANVTDSDVEEGAREIFERFSSLPSDAVLRATLARILTGLPNEERLVEINGRMQELINTLKA